MADEIGTLRQGACADVAVLTIEQGRFPLIDSDGVEEIMDRRFVVVATIRQGSVLKNVA